MTPTEAIAALDEALRIAGVDAVLRRVSGTAQTVTNTCNLRVNVRQFKPVELVGEVKQGDRQVILSPTEMTAQSFPAPPRRNDKLLLRGKQYNIEAVDPIEMANVLVRVELIVRG